MAKHAAGGRHYGPRGQRTRTRILPVLVFLVLVLAGLMPVSHRILTPESASSPVLVPIVPAPPNRALLQSHHQGITGPWLRLGANADNPGSQSTPDSSLGAPGWAEIGERCAPDDPYRNPHCHVLGTRSGMTPEHSIYALGNSHTVQLSAALVEAVDRHGDWSLRSQAAPGCAFSFVEHPTDDCEQLWQVGTRYILEMQPDLVIVMASRTNRFGTQLENLLPGLVEWVEMITARTTSRVVVIRDSPRFDFDMHRCAQQHGTTAAECTAVDTAPQLDAHRLALESVGAAYIDLNRRICPDGVCRPVVGGVWTYMDDNHLSAD